MEARRQSARLASALQHGWAATHLQEPVSVALLHPQLQRMKRLTSCARFMKSVSVALAPATFISVSAMPAILERFSAAMRADRMFSWKPQSPIERGGSS